MWNVPFKFYINRLSFCNVFAFDNTWLLFGCVKKLDLLNSDCPIFLQESWKHFTLSFNHIKLASFFQYYFGRVIRQIGVEFLMMGILADIDLKLVSSVGVSLFNFRKKLVKLGEHRVKKWYISVMEIINFSAWNLRNFIFLFPNHELYWIEPFIIYFQFQYIFLYFC